MSDFFPQNIKLSIMFAADFRSISIFFRFSACQGCFLLARSELAYLLIWCAHEIWGNILAVL